MPYDILSEVPQFKTFSQSTIEKLKAGAELKAFAPGEVILTEGEAADAAYVLVEGDVQIYRERANGRHIFLRKLTPGALFGEQALVSGNPRNACARALTKVVALRLAEPDFMAAVSTESGVRTKLLAEGIEQLNANIAYESSFLQAMKLDGGPSKFARERSFADGEMLFREGDEPHHVYVILAGRVAIYQNKDGAQVLLTRMTHGQTLGELALKNRSLRAATAVAEGPVRVYEIDAAYFHEMHESSAEVREHLQVLQRVYLLPRRGFVTQYSGKYLDQAALNTIYDLENGVRLIASNVFGEKLCSLERVRTGAEAELKLSTVRYADMARGIERELRLSSEGVVYGATSLGEWPDLPEIYTAAMECRPLERSRIEAFCLTGSLGAAKRQASSAKDNKIICQCVNVRRDTLNAAIISGADTVAELQAATSCGTVCGGCLPRVREMLGGPGSSPVEVVEEIERYEGVRSFRLRPLRGIARDSLPGQHIVLEAEIDGDWMCRPYTLSAPTRGGAYEVTIKRETLGRFSRWMFDERRADMVLRVSEPQGDFIWTPGQGTAICLVAGIGVTPALAICRAIVEGNLSDRLHIDYSSHSSLEFVCSAELLAAAEMFENITVNLRNTSDHGRLDATGLTALHAEHPDATYFLCGPPGYLHSVMQLLVEIGVPAARIRSEVFIQIGGPPKIDVPHNVQAKFTRRRSAKSDPAILFQTPKVAPPPAAPHWLSKWLLDFSARYSFQLTIAGKRVAPFAALIDWFEYKLAGTDPNVASDHLGVFKNDVLGMLNGPLDTYEFLERTIGGNRDRGRRMLKAGTPLPPKTPDGMTFTFTIKSFPLTQFMGIVPRVDTGWKRSSSRPATTFYFTRSPTAAKTLLCDSKNIDRGALPYHYWQQLIGYPDRSSDVCHRPAGVVAGQYHSNRTWSEDRALVLRQAGPAVIDERTADISDIVDRICEEEIDTFIDQHPGQVFDGEVFMTQIARRAILYTTLPGLDEALLDRLGHTLLEVTMESVALITRAVVRDRSATLAFEAAPAKLRAAVGEIASAVRAAHARHELGREQLKSPMISHILFGADGKPPSDADLVPLVVPFLVAGHETTAKLLAWGLYELGRHPEVYRALQNEVDAFSAAHGGRRVTAHDYDERPITMAVMLELQRLHPVFPFSLRTATRAGSVPPDPETGIGGFDYPADAVLVHTLYAINLLPETFPKPNEFRIQRFLEGITPDMTLKQCGAQVRKTAVDLEARFRLLTFSAGPATCPGRNFNMIEFFLVMDGLMRRYDFELENPDRLVVSTHDTAIVGPTPGQIAIRIRRR